MVVFPVVVAFHTVDWLPVAVGSYLAQFPGERILVVDNNPQPGETGWSAACRREARWLDTQPRVDVIRAGRRYPGAPVTRTHGMGIDLALEWCQSRGAEVMLHLEPDCLITGRAWRDHLLGAIEEGAWMAGMVRKPWGPIHPTPSAWLIREARTSFQEQSKRNDRLHPRFGELIDGELLRRAAEATDVWDWAKETWDTGDRAWFRAAVLDKAKLVDGAGFHHFWFGSTAHCLPMDQLMAKFPELAGWLGGTSVEPRRRGVDTCAFRREVRSTPETEVACCGLLQELSGVADVELTTVPRVVCEHCCESANPSTSTLNPVVASRVYRLADRVIALGGVDGFDTESAKNLRSFAESYLDLRIPGEGASPAARRRDKPCGYLGAEVGSRVVATAGGHERAVVYACGHPDHVETTVAECRVCRDYRDRPESEPVKLERLLPPPAERVGRAVRAWAVGVTTAPRPMPTLDVCLDSLFRAGWREPRLFVDSAVTIPERYSELPVTFRETKLGPFPNYYLALAELLMREPGADAYMLIQDDIIFDDRYDIRAYLEANLWPEEPMGALSLYCPRAYTKPREGWHRFEGRWVWGALALVFSRESAKRFVTDPEVFEHRSDPKEGLVKIDIEIGKWAYAHGLPIYFPTPSLVQHIGDSSSLWLEPESRAMGDRRADRFAGDIS